MNDMKDLTQLKGKLGRTQLVENTIREIPNSPDFPDSDSEVIYESLKESMKLVPFGDFLKRYICRKAWGSEDFAEIPTEKYQQYITDEFEAHGTPCAFKETTARLRNLAKNWLEQKTVQRSVVLLLGFGLEMTPEEVNLFLTRYLTEEELNPKDPFEVICFYCYANRLPYADFRRILDQFQQRQGLQQKAMELYAGTAMFAREMGKIRTEDQLWAYLLFTLGGLQGENTRHTPVIRFRKLYEEVCDRIAALRTADEEDTARQKAAALQDRLSRTDRYSDEQKIAMVKKAREDYHRYTATEITPVDIEREILSAVPVGSQGNYLPVKASTLNEHFAGKQLNRQRLAKLLNGSSHVTRYDLVTLQFLAMAMSGMDADDAENALTEESAQRYHTFVESANETLAACGMGSLYAVNPYEAFLMMCMLAADPLCTYAEVWGLSYEEEV